MKLVIKDIDALGIYVPYARMIAVNVNASVLGKIAALLHELFHYFTDLLITNPELWRHINRSFDEFWLYLFTERR
jgi:Zn-dependent peptidase ImmA (M78 family)